MDHPVIQKLQWIFRLLTLVNVALVVSPMKQQSTAPTKPHIIFILADDLGWYDVSWHNPKAITPNLETLAKEGIILDQSYVQPICTPTRSALLTGRYPFTIGRQHGVLRFKTPTGLLLNATLLPQSLKEAGYTTHAIGKWHLGFCHWDFTPTSRGFDTFSGYYNGEEDHYLHTTTSRYYKPIAGQPKENFTYGYDFRNDTEPDLSPNGIYDTYVYASRVENLLNSRNPADPMFLYLALQSVHTPMQVPEIYREPFQYIGNEDREILLGMSWAMDEAIGTVLDALKATGHYDNSVIIFTSDNGGNVRYGNNWPLRGGKGGLWEGGTRSAGFIHSPLLKNTGFVSDTLVHVTDWYPTLVGLAGGIVPEDTDGFDQWEAITTGTQSPRTTFVYNIDNITITDNTTQVNAAIRKGEYKMIVGDPGDDSWTSPPEGITSESPYHQPTYLDTFNIKDDLQKNNIDKGPQKNKRSEKINTPEMSVFASMEEIEIMLYNVIDDPEERNNIADSHQDIVQDILHDLQAEFLRMVPPDTPSDDPMGDPIYFNNVWSPGWCNP